MRIGTDGLARCDWVSDDPEYMRYHDEEWGVALHGDQPLFEKICLEGFQAGLSWITILKRRPGFREAFHGFQIEAVASLDSSDVERLMNDTGIVRNRAKIEATIGNAKATLDLLADSPSALDTLVWSHAPQPRHEQPSELSEIPAVTAESHALSAALRAQGFRFVGATTMYALMQSAGLVNDHIASCFRSNLVG